MERARTKTETRPLVVRDAKDRDQAELLLLWRELMEVHTRCDPRFALGDLADHRFLDYLETTRNRPDYRVRVALYPHAPESLVGFSVSCILPNAPIYRTRWVGYINDLCVTMKLRGQGIGRYLVGDAVRWLRQQGADSVEVYVAKANAAAQRFWRAEGARDYLERLSLDLARWEDR